MKRILDEPSCSAYMKNSGNERMIERKRSWKHKVKPCNDLDGALRWYNRENLELRKEKMNTRTENYFIMNNLRKKRIESPRGNKNKIYCMLILHQIKLMTSNGFGILLILVERIKRDIAQTWEGIDGTTGGIWKQRMNWYDNKGNENVERTTIRIENESSKGTIHREELENEWRYLRGFRYMRMKRSWID